MVSGKWPLGSEVKRRELTGGAMLYDASRVSNLTAAWFDPEHWLSRGELEGVAHGRGAAHLIATGGNHYVLRHYRRGGLVAHLSRDRYWWKSEWRTRPFAEWQLMYHLAQAGLPVPAPVAARYRRSGLTYSGDLITTRLMNCQSLAAHLGEEAVPMLGWIAIGRCIRRFHDGGVCHADLNAHNILLGEEPETVYLIDFDRGTLRKPGLWCDSNLVRLRRSLEKVTYALPAERFTEADWHALLDGYRVASATATAAAPAA
jgi:3-deoxy-D-manno-octulosonic acid kinase